MLEYVRTRLPEYSGVFTLTLPTDILKAMLLVIGCHHPNVMLTMS